MRISKSNKTSVKASNKLEENSTASDLISRSKLKEAFADMRDGYPIFHDDEMFSAKDIARIIDDAPAVIAANTVVTASTMSVGNRTDKALQHIKAAIDILGKSGNKDAVTKDSIANLATVMFDIKGSTLLAAKQLSANGLSEGMTIKDIDDGQEFTVGRVEKGEKPNTFDVYDSDGSLVGTYDNAPQFECVD